jgi:hypothetical protein
LPCQSSHQHLHFTIFLLAPSTLLYILSLPSLLPHLHSTTPFTEHTIKIAHRMPQPSLTSTITPALAQPTMASGVENSGGARIKYVTAPIIVHSQPDDDARTEAGQLRCSNNRANLPYFLQVKHNSDWKKIFCGPGWPFPYEWAHKDNVEYSKLVIYHIAAQNHMDVSTQASQLVTKLGPPGNFGAVLDAVSNRHPRDFFTTEELDFYSEAFLLKVFEWLRLCLLQQNPQLATVPAPVPYVEPINGASKVMSKSTTNSPVLKPIKHRKSKSHNGLSSEYTPCTDMSDGTNPGAVEIPPIVNSQLLAVPPSADSRRIVSEKPSAKPAIRGGDRTVSGPALDLLRGPKTGPMMGTRSFVPPTPPVGPSQVLPMRPSHPLRMSTSQQSTPVLMFQQPVAIPRRDIPTGPHNAHVGQFQPQAVRIPSGEMMRHSHQIPGHMFVHPGMPQHPGHPTVMGLPPPPHMNMPSPGTSMSPMHPVYYDPSMVPQGARSMTGQEVMFYGADPQQMRQLNHPPPSPYGPHRQMAHGPGRFSAQGHDMSRPPRQPQQPYGGNMRGRGRKQIGRGRGGMPSYDGGRKNSMPQSVDRPFLGGMNGCTPPGPLIVERNLPNPRRESISMRENVKPGLHLHETERFPDFHEAEIIINMNLPKEQQCLRKSIGPDVEGMDSLWVGNIAPGTSDQMLKDLIEQHVPVKELKPILHGDREFGWSIIT